MKASSQSGNIFFYILMAIVLIGALTVALRDTGGMDSNIDKEKAKIIAAEVIRYSDEVAKGTKTLLDNGVSENDIRFAHPNALATDYGTITTTPQNQVFSSQGGMASYKFPPTNSTTTTTSYGFVGGRSMPQAGSASADLTISLGYVTDQTCEAINKQLGITTKPSTTCGSATSFRTGNTFDPSPVVISPSAFSNLPALQACIYCTDRSMNIYMSTILAR